MRTPASNGSSTSMVTMLLAGLFLSLVFGLRAGGQSDTTSHLGSGPPRFLVSGSDPAGPPVSVDPLQQPTLRKRIAVTLNDVPRADALRAIARAAGVNLVYESQVISGGTIRFRDDSISVAAALVTVLSGTGTDVLLDANGSLVIRARVVGSAATAMIRGTISDSVASLAIPGAIVSLNDARGATLARVLSDGLGRFAIPLDTAGTELRVLRIGFRPRSIAIRAGGGALAVNVRLMRAPLTIDTIVATAARCPAGLSSQRGRSLWAQVRTGLMAVQVATIASSADIRSVGYHRDLNVLTQVTSFLERAEVANTAARSFTAVRTAEGFEQLGYMESGNRTTRLLGPDIDVLLDDSFTRTHCFEIRGTRGPSKHEVGLVFAPADTRDGVAEVQGTIWVDTAATVLTEIEFGYTQVKSLIPHVDPGGSILFLSLANGVTLIDRWVIRVPEFKVGEPVSTVQQTGTRILLRNGPAAQYRESGGAVRELRWSDGTTWRAPPVVLRARVTADPTTLAAGVGVWLDGTDLAARANAAGTVTIDSIISGKYTVQAAESRFANTGFSQLPRPPLVSMLRGDTTRTTVALESATATASRLCRRAFGANLERNRGALVVRVIIPNPEEHHRPVITATTADLHPISDLHVAMLPNPGGMLVCQIPLDREVLLHVASDTLVDDRRLRVAGALKVDTLTAVLQAHSHDGG